MQVASLICSITAGIVSKLVFCLFTNRVLYVLPTSDVIFDVVTAFRVNTTVFLDLNSCILVHLYKVSEEYSMPQSGFL